MAHVKAAGAAKRTVNVAGKRLGIKKFGGEVVKPGDIIVRQRGTKYHPGENIGMGRDHTLFSKVQGTVSFRRLTGPKRTMLAVDITPLKVKASKPKVKSKTTAKKAATVKATK